MLPDDLREEVDAAEDNGVDSCVWLEPISGECTNYEHRPFVCREFEVGCESCLSFRRFYNID